jgi:hypothetical protein
MPAKRRATLEADFKRLAGKGGEGVSLEAFMDSGEVAELLKEKLLARAEVSLRGCVGGCGGGGRGLGLAVGSFPPK